MTVRLLVALCFAAATVAIFPKSAAWQSPAAVPPNLKFVTHTYMVPMRDGVSLHTVVFVPFPENIKRAAVVIRTPYGTDTLKNDGATFVSQGFVAVMQDFRGRYASQGTFQCWREAGTDGFDTLEWVKTQPWSNGVTFGNGGSANGIACYLEDQLTPPLLRAQFSIVGTAQLHRTIFQGGAYRESLISGWLKGINESSFEPNFIRNEAPGAWWEPLDMSDKWGTIKWPAIHLTGWYDIFLQQQIDAFEAYQTQSTLGQGLNFLFVLPSGHCEHGQIPWPSNATLGAGVAEQLTFQLFKALEHTTTDATYEVALQQLQAAAVNISRIWWYVMGPGLPGSLGNYWTSAMNWPTPSTTSLYLTVDGTLEPQPASQDDIRSFLYDPRNPVPTRGGNNLILPQCGPWDQSNLENRPDVLTFTSSPFTSPVAITGRLSVDLFVSSNATDTDFTVKITDVFPNGTVSMLIQDGIFRMRWRGGSVPQPVLIQPGQIYPITVDVWSTSYILNPGHRVRVVVSSSNSPRFSVNPNDGSPLYSPTATQIVARNSIHTGGSHASRLVLPVVPLPSPAEAMRPQFQ